MKLFVQLIKAACMNSSYIILTDVEILEMN